MRIFFILIYVVFGHFAQAQYGTIIYYRQPDYRAIASKMPYLSQEEKDRIMFSWGKSDYKEKYELVFSPEKVIYQEAEQEGNYGYSWKEQNDIFIRNQDDKTTEDLRFLLDKNFIVKDDIPRHKWKIMNEIKEVAGYLCMRAETVDTVLQIPVVAWFTDKISCTCGPEGYAGLPGTILQLIYNTDDVVYTAYSVKLSEVPIPFRLPKKMKGEETDYAIFNEKVQARYRDRIAAKRNPFWEIRY